MSESAEVADVVDIAPGGGTLDHQHQFSADDVCRVVGERVRDARRALSMTMAQFAELANLSLGMVSKIEHGQTSPSLSTLTRLAHAARVPITAFLR